MKASLTFITAATMLSEVSALGINCRGSYLCGAIDPLLGAQWPGNEVEKLRSLIHTIPDNRWFNNGQQIACVSVTSRASGICAFFQNTNGWDGKKAKEIANHIFNHKCKTCGSSPTDYPNSNDVANGQLTMNYVSNPCTGFDEVAKVC